MSLPETDFDRERRWWDAKAGLIAVARRVSPAGHDATGR